MHNRIDTIIAEQFDSFIDTCKKNHILNEDDNVDQENLDQSKENIESAELNKPTENSIELKDSLGVTLKKDILPEKESIELILKSINNSFMNSYNSLRKYANFDEQIKAWQKQVKGVCDSIMTKVQHSGFNTSDTQSCSPMAYNVLADSNNRDIDMLELCGACIIFYNSLK